MSQRNSTLFADVPVITQDELGKKGNRETIRANAERDSFEIYKIPIEKIVIVEDFNVRDEANYGDIEELADSLIQNGQILAGKVDAREDGTFALVEGHRRLAAYKILQKRGYTDLVFKATINKDKTTQEQRILEMFITQDNQKLTPPESAKLIGRLINLGNTPKMVATKICKSEAYISQMLQYNTEEQTVKNFVDSGDITLASILTLQKDIPNQQERATAVKITVAAKNPAKKKVTAREVVAKVSGKDRRHKKAEDIVDAIFTLYSITETREEAIAAVLRFL